MFFRRVPQHVSRMRSTRRILSFRKSYWNSIDQRHILLHHTWMFWCIHFRSFFGWQCTTYTSTWMKTKRTRHQDTDYQSDSALTTCLTRFLIHISRMGSRRCIQSWCHRIILKFLKTDNSPMSHITARTFELDISCRDVHCLISLYGDTREIAMGVQVILSLWLYQVFDCRHSHIVESAQNDSTCATALRASDTSGQTLSQAWAFHCLAYENSTQSNTDFTIFTTPSIFTLRQRKTTHTNFSGQHLSLSHYKESCVNSKAP